MCKLIILMGPASCGKTYLSQYISHDIQTIYTGKDEEIEELLRLCENFNTVLLESSHLSIPHNRHDFFQRVEFPRDTEIIGVWVDAGLNTILSQNQSRIVPVNEEVLRDQFKFRVSPRNVEPFNKRVFVVREPGLGISSTSPTIKPIIDILSEI